MKKIFYFLIFVLLMLFGATNCLAAEETYLIHKNQSFDQHKVGDKPSAFVWHPCKSEYIVVDSVFYDEDVLRLAAYNNTEIVKVEKDGNVDNLAAKFNAVETIKGEAAMARALIQYYPIKENGVISFSFRVDDFNTDKIVWFNGNVIQNRDVNYTDNNNLFNFIKIEGNKVYFNDSQLIAEDIQADTWYRIDLEFDLKNSEGTFYFNGNPKSVTLPKELFNVSEVRFDFPVSAGNNEGAWYIDDLKIYESEKLVDDAIINAQWKEFTDSTFYTSYEFDSSRQTCYDYMAFLRSKDKRFAVIHTNKLFDGSKVIDLPVKFISKDNKVIVPIRAVAEGYGAKVDWNDPTWTITVTYSGKELKVVPGKNNYYINGVSKELNNPVTLVDGYSYIQIDDLLTFLGKEYTLQKDILWLDKPVEFNWHMPLNESGDELSGASNTSLDENIYNRTLRMCLFDRPLDEDIDTAIKTYSPNNQHPRIEFTPESLARAKEGAKTDKQLQMIINNIFVSAEKIIGKPGVERKLHDGKRASYISTTGDYLSSLSAAYLLSDDEAKKAEYKSEMWRHICHVGDTELFPDWHMQQNSALGTCEGMYGFARAFDWVDWTQEEKDFIVDICRRNVFDHALHAYTCNGHAWYHSICYGNGNQSLISNGGVMVAAIAMYDEDPEYFQDVIRGALRATEGGTIVYFPNGEYAEGISYWRYAGGRFPQVFKAMQTSMGTDWGRTEIPGVLETATFPFRMRGATTAYAFGDGQPEDAVIPLMMFCADQTNNKSLAQYRKDKMGQSGSIVDVANWVFDTEKYNDGLDVYDADIYNQNNSTVILKTGWSLADATIALHGGANNDPHGHMDVGSFQLDMNGVRFGMDLPRDEYNLRDLGHYNKKRVDEFWPEGYPFTGGHYYRIKGEGHNTVIANRQETNIKSSKDAKSYDMNRGGKSTFTKTEFGETTSFAILDMTDTNDIYESAIRGVKLDKMNNIIEVQDNFTAKSETDFLWSMHTYAQIEVAKDGKSAILAQNNQRIKATIINDCDYKFEVLPAAFDETYGTSVKPAFETPNVVYGNDDPFYILHGKACDVLNDARKLAVRTEKGKDVKNFRLAVTFQPYVEGNTAKADYVPLESWKNNKVSRQNLTSVTVDGKPLNTFNPDKYNYSVLVVTEKSDVPEIKAKAADSNVKLETIKATTVPGVTNLILKKDGVNVGQYSFLITPINNTAKFHSDKQLPIYSYSVSSEPQTQNGVANLFDGDFTTKYATDEQGGNVLMDLGSVVEGNLKLNISCLSGDKRTENFKIEYSLDGVDYTEVFNGTNSGTTTGIEQFDIGNKARYVRVSFYGSSQGAWVSVTELFVSKE